ncbi:MAG: SIS domain-containing protein [Thermomicrobiales bacterium]|nr:SIS domain-containing protein [Thermomicrobiales bacterium]MCO5223489.1 SIS domain-containing protein [Thermomicrobiales bacterium]
MVEERLPFLDEAAEIVAEQVEAIARIDETSVDALLTAIDGANRVFVLGEGRSGLVGRMFAMRLMHLGHQAFVVGETTTPSITNGDLLIAISGSGETGSVVLLAEGASKAAVTIAAVTANAESRLAHLADFTIVLPTQHKLEGASSRQYGGSLFEQTTLLLFETMVSMRTAGDASAGFASLAKRHANLE